MPSPVYDLAIMAPDHRLFEGRARSLVAPGASGYFGVLARHAPMVAELAPGVLTVTEENGRKNYLAVSSGFLEVSLEGVTILADAAEAAADIDVSRAQAAEERARQRLRAHAKDTDLSRAEAALRRALARLYAVEMSGTGR
jgi:F-type H+-transporting ATPase subunit epsilon